MLEFETKRPTVDFKLDDKVCNLPYRLTVQELRDMGSVDQTESDALIGWFADFLRKFIGDKVDEIGDDVFMAIFSAWNDARKGDGNADAGER